MIRPTLREELKRFKDIVKQITNREIEQEKKKWFGMEKKTKAEKGGGPRYRKSPTRNCSVCRNQ